jgi:hypothetical protein
LQGYSVWLCFAETVLAIARGTIGFVLPKSRLRHARLELGLFCQESSARGARRLDAAVPQAMSHGTV